jgi:hypothetical protein
MSEPLSSITDFLQQGHFQFRFFDLGRRVTRLSNQLFANIENQQSIYPYPFQQSAWLAVLFWNSSSKHEPIIWFLRFPIDELGYLQLASRDAFLQQLFDQLGTGLHAQQQGKPVLDTLKESPFAFKPSADRLAMFHSKAAKLLSQPASRYYVPTQNYFRGEGNYEQWELLGLQGIADVLARLDEDNNEIMLTHAIAAMPEMPLEVVANLLENVEPKHQLSTALLLRLKEQIDTALIYSNALPALMGLLRGLSNSAVKSIRYQAWWLILNSKLATNIELLAILSGRAWQDLQDEKLFNAFLEALAQCNEKQFFILLVDLLAIPTMKASILAALRSPKRSEQLAQRIGGFFQMSRTLSHSSK